jgi:DNA-binding Lrp family transcriptional regulator
MSKQQELWMSQKDRDRLKVLHEVERGHLTQPQAGAQLKLSARWVRTLVARLRQEGDGGILHRLRGRASQRKIPEAVREKAVRLVQREYRDFGPTLATEYLAEQHGLGVSKETLRQWLIAGGVWKRKRRRVEEVHVWRARRECRGELVQWDTSEHAWLEGRGPEPYLIIMIDDATNRLHARFVPHDSTEENLRMLKIYLERWGRPLAFYTDQAGLFKVNRPANQDEQLAGREPLTQIGRALAELGIEWIPAHSPQAKGRVERCFGTLQDRLVKGLRLAGAGTLAQANAYLEQEFLPAWEGRFTVAPANPTDAHRPLGRPHDLAAILSGVEARVVTNDYTLRYQGKIYQIARADLGGGLRGAKVRVEKRLDGTVAVRFRERYLAVSVCTPAPQPLPRRPKVRAPKNALPSSRPGSRRWMEGFSLKPSPPLWKILKQEAGKARPQEAR